MTLHYTFDIVEDILYDVDDTVPTEVEQDYELELDDENVKEAYEEYTKSTISDEEWEDEKCLAAYDDRDFYDWLLEQYEDDARKECEEEYGSDDTRFDGWFRR